MMTEKELLQQLNALPRTMEPPQNLWSRIEARLDAPAPQRRTPAVFGLAIAATLVVGVAVGLIAGRAGQTPTDPRAHLVVPQVLIAGMQQEYAGALAEWRGMAPDGHLSPEAISQLELELERLQEAVGAIGDAMAEDPDSPYLARMWRSVQQRQLDVLRTLYGQPHASEPPADSDTRTL